MTKLTFEVAVNVPEDCQPAEVASYLRDLIAGKRVAGFTPAIPMKPTVKHLKHRRLKTYVWTLDLSWVVVVSYSLGEAKELVRKRMRHLDIEKFLKAQPTIITGQGCQPI